MPGSPADGRAVADRSRFTVESGLYYVRDGDLELSSVSDLEVQSAGFSNLTRLDDDTPSYPRLGF